MPGLFAFVLFSLVAVTLVSADGYEMKQKVFLPPTFYVGDLVELRMRIDVGDSILPSVPKEIPESTWLEIHEIRAIPIADEYDIRMRFASYRAGKFALPGFEIGEISIDEIPFETTSIRETETSNPYGIFDPVYLPGTKLFIGLVSGTVLFGPLLLLLLIGWIRRVAKRISFGVKRPYRKLRRELDILRASVARTNSRDFYQRLFDAFRRYLTSRTGVNYSSYTTREMDRRIRKDFHDIESLRQFEAMIDAIDCVKFGGGEADEMEKMVELTIVQSSAAEIEERYNRRSDQ
jgi:hypothetical protein